MYFIGMDLGGTDLKLGLIDQTGTIRYKQVYPTLNTDDPHRLADSFADCIERVVAASGLDWREVAGLGIGAPGLMRSLDGELDFVTNLPALSNFGLGAAMRQRLGLPVTVDNDVNAMVLAEFLHGAAKGCRNVVGLTLGTGVGGGLIIDGRLYRGASFCAGELGHISIESNGLLCNCGNYGCLERYVNRDGIVGRFEALYVHKGQASSIARYLDHGAITPLAIAAAASAGDQLARFVLFETGRFLGTALSGIINILNPEMVVVGGGIANAGELILEPARQEIARRAYPLPARTARLVQAGFLNDAGIVGAAALAEAALAEAAL